MHLDLNPREFLADDAGVYARLAALRYADLRDFVAENNEAAAGMGLGVQGLADVFAQMRLAFDSEGAQALNREIFETMYFAALACSCDPAKVDGHYESYPGSPVSKGILQYDMWGVTPTARWDWAALKAKIAEHGVRNSLLLAPMPTASTAQILGNNECFEPYTSNIYSRRTLSGELSTRETVIVETPDSRATSARVGLSAPRRLRRSGDSELDIGRAPVPIACVF